MARADEVGVWQQAVAVRVHAARRIDLPELPYSTISARDPYLICQLHATRRLEPATHFRDEEASETN